MSRRAVPQSVGLIQPQLAKPFHRGGWLYAAKYDGGCIVAFKNGSRVRLASRTGRYFVTNLARPDGTIWQDAPGSPMRLTPILL